MGEKKDTLVHVVLASDSATSAGLAVAGYSAIKQTSGRGGAVGDPGGFGRGNNFVPAKVLERRCRSKFPDDEVPALVLGDGEISLARLGAHPDWRSVAAPCFALHLHGHGY